MSTQQDVNVAPSVELKPDEKEEQHLDEDDWSHSGDIFSNTFTFQEEATSSVGEGDSECKGESQDDTRDLKELMLRLKQSNGDDDDDDTLETFRKQTQIVQAQMGNMTLCRGDRGKRLYEAGAIPALLSTLNHIFHRLPPPSNAIHPEENDQGMQVVLLATCCWRAIRDLSCHNANVRAAVRTLTCDDLHTNGLKLMIRYVSFYNTITWHDIVPRQHLSLLTSVIGAIRNVTHSTGDNCRELYEHGLSDLLSWRLLHAGSELPDVTRPWREAAFRAGACLINMSELCPECARDCARNVTLLHILIEVWGGKASKTMKAPILHLGLAAILKAAKEELPLEVYAQSWNDILTNEEKRKQRARRVEQARKEQLICEQEGGQAST